LVGTLLMCSYAPSLGGLATPVGTAPNLIGLRLLEQATGTRPSFAHWCVVFAPLAIISTLITGAWLARGGEKHAAPAALPKELSAAKLGPWSLAERTCLIVFIVVIPLWIGPVIAAAR